MLSERILKTITFFDLQDYPLTAVEIQQYLVPDYVTLRDRVDGNFELLETRMTDNQPIIHLDTIVTHLDSLVASKKLVEQNGFYALPAREELIPLRQNNYLFGLKRERLIRRYLLLAKHFPFVRGIALAGSQALGQQRANSDIDLLILTDSRFMWTARTLLSFWFQILGVRRHGNKIANRFCLNHYLANPREVDAERNLYKAMEYLKLRLLVYPETIRQFQIANQRWIKQFFPNANFHILPKTTQSFWQKFTEQVYNNVIGKFLEQLLRSWQEKRIDQDQFVFIREDELSFHPESKHFALLQNFFQVPTSPAGKPIHPPQLVVTEQ